MLGSRFVVCSVRQDKPVTREVCDTRADADAALLRLREADAADPEDEYWIAEVGTESEAWRWLVAE